MVMIVTGYFFCLFTGIPNLDALHAEYYEDPQRTTEDHQHHLLLYAVVYTVIQLLLLYILLYISYIYSILL